MSWEDASKEPQPWLHSCLSGHCCGTLPPVVILEGRVQVNWHWWPGRKQGCKPLISLGDEAGAGAG